MKRLVLVVATVSMAVTACSGGTDSESSTATARANPTTTGPAAFTELAPPPPPSDGEDASSAPVSAQFTDTDAEGIAVHAGFTTTTGFGRRQTIAAALITLPDRPEGLLDAEVTFTLLDEGGEVVDSASEVVPFIPPGATVPVAPFLMGMGLPEDPASIEVAVAGRWGAPQEWAGTELAIVDAALVEGGSGAEVAGEMRNDGDAATSEEIVWHCAFLRSGDIIGGARSQIVIPVPPGGVQEFNFELHLDLEADEVTCRATT